MSVTLHEQPGIPLESLRACLQNQYDLYPVTLEFLPLGHDYDAGVYRAVSEQGTSYLLKVTTRPLYEPRCLVPRYLNEQGITSVVAPIPTNDGALWTQLEGWTVIVYPFIGGDTGWTGMTDEQWKKTGAIFRRIHQVEPPSEGFELVRKETFDPTMYSQWVHDFESQHLHTREGGSDAAQTLRASWLAHQSTIHTIVTSMEKLAGVLQKQSGPYVICHADLHASNLIRTPAGQVFVIDWDEVLLAPRERDFIFVREPYAAAFWEGYGQIEIDWVALAYYQWERVIQDLIEYARSACFRDEWAEESRADAARLFHVNLAGDGGRGNLAAAYAAAAHLPGDF